MMRSSMKYLGLWAAGLVFAFGLIADEFKLTDGTVYSGHPTSFNEEGTVIKLDAGGFSPRVPWTKVPQETLKELAQDPKAKAFVEPFIELPPDTGKNKAKEREIVLKPVPRAEYYAKKPGFMTAFTTPVGLLLLLAVLGASIYAGYEVAIYKRHPPAVVCGVSAIIPILGPVIFLFVPPMEHVREAPMPEGMEPEPAAGVAAETQSKRKSTGSVGVPSGGGLSVSKRFGFNRVRHCPSPSRLTRPLQITHSRIGIPRLTIGRFSPATIPYTWATRPGQWAVPPTLAALVSHIPATSR